MADHERGFPEELQEVSFDVARDAWARAGEMPARGKRFFFDYAHAQLNAPLRPGEVREDRIATGLLLMFMVGREHALRGYRPPYPKEDSPSPDLPDPLGADMPQELEDDIERMFNKGDD